MQYKHVYKFYKLLGICIISVLGSITSLGGTTELRSDPNYKGKIFSCRKISLIECSLALSPLVLIHTPSMSRFCILHIGAGTLAWFSLIIRSMVSRSKHYIRDDYDPNHINIPTSKFKLQDRVSQDQSGLETFKKLVGFELR